MLPRHPGKAIVWLSLVFVALLYLLSKDSLASLGNDPFLTLAQLAALLGLVLFSFSFIIAARSNLIEEAFGGLDHAYIFHHKTGVWSFSLLVTHLIAVAVAYGLNGSPLLKLTSSSLIFLSGEIAISLMATIILTIIFAKIKYQHFMFVQKFFAVPYAFGAYHMLIANSDVSRFAPLRLFMLIMVALGLISWLYREFFFERLAPQGSYTVKSVDTKGAEIFEITLTPDGEPLKAKAGQFAYFSFRSGALSSEPHPFSFTSPAGASELTFAAKGLGDFTKTLGQAKPGDKVVVFGPYGKFFEDLDPDKKNIFIAGGIGITPFLSALRSNSAANATTFYATRNDEDCVFNAELDRLSSGANAFKYHFHASEQRGYLTADIVEKRAGGLADKTIFLCGPAPMMKKLTDGFLAKGVPRHRIIFEKFSYS